MFTILTIGMLLATVLIMIAVSMTINKKLIKREQMIESLKLTLEAYEKDFKERFYDR